MALEDLWLLNSVVINHNLGIFLKYRTNKGFTWQITKLFSFD